MTKRLIAAALVAVGLLAVAPAAAQARDTNWPCPHCSVVGP